MDQNGGIVIAPMNLRIKNPCNPSSWEAEAGRLPDTRLVATDKDSISQQHPKEGLLFKEIGSEWTNVFKGSNIISLSLV